MPVFRAMQPQIAEQYSGGGGYGQPMLGGPPTMPGATGPAGVVGPGGATNPPMGGGPYQPGTGMPGMGGTTATDAFDPLKNPTEAVYRGLLNRGLNPDAPTHGISMLLKKADDIVRQLAVRLGVGGQADVLTGPGFQDAVNALISGASSGRGAAVLSGGAEGRGLANSLNQLINGTNAGGASEGVQYLADMIKDSPETAVGFLDSLLYGNRAPSVRSALSRPLAGQVYRFNQYVGSPEGAAQDINRSALDILLSGILGSGNQLPPGVQRQGAVGPGQALPLQQQLLPPGSVTSGPGAY